MRTPLVFVASALVLSALGCSSSSDGPASGTDSGTVADTATSTDTAMPMDSGMDMGGDETPIGDAGDDSSASKPATPTISAVEKMAGALHVTWKLNDTGLTNVLLFRKKDTGAYAKAYTLPGTATAQHDMAATSAGATYCYQVQTVKAGAMSELSAEMCGTP